MDSSARPTAAMPSGAAAKPIWVQSTSIAESRSPVRPLAHSGRITPSRRDHSATVGERLVTASVGVAEVRPACDFQQLYRLADEALYDAKRGGRNKVVVQRHQDAPGHVPDREVAISN